MLYVAVMSKIIPNCFMIYVAVMSDTFSIIYSTWFFQENKKTVVSI